MKQGVDCDRIINYHHTEITENTISALQLAFTLSLNKTRRSVIAEGPRAESCQLKSCQLPHISAETICTTSPEEIEVMKLEGYSGPMCNKHVHSTTTRSSRFHCLIGVINKPTTDEFVDITCIPTTCCPLRKHSLITRLRLHMADPCTKFEVSSISRCGNITWGVKL